MPRFIALLRGINVNGKNKILMAELRQSLAQRGLLNIKTVIQSGNIIFDVTPPTTPTLSDIIHDQIQKDFGLNISVIIRNHQQWQQIVSQNPFSQQVNLSSTLHVTFLEKKPDKSDLMTLNDIKTDDQFYCDNRQIYLLCKNGYGRTKLTNNTIEKKLSMKATTRNWKTVAKLLLLSDNTLTF